MSEEQIDWRTEAKGVIQDVCHNVKHIGISESVEVPDSIYINLETLEGDKVTVRLNSSGFVVVGRKFDDNQLETAGDELHPFETVYALLHSISPGYAASFAHSLQQKLNNLAGGGSPSCET